MRGILYLQQINEICHGFKDNEPKPAAGMYVVSRFHLVGTSKLRAATLNKFSYFNNNVNDWIIRVSCLYVLWARSVMTQYNIFCIFLLHRSKYFKLY